MSGITHKYGEPKPDSLLKIRNKAKFSKTDSEVKCAASNCCKKHAKVKPLRRIGLAWQEIII